MFDLLHENAVADLDLLRLSDRQGDVFTNPREVDFAFKAVHGENANDLAEYVNEKNFGKASVQNLEDGTFRVIVLIDLPITQDLIFSVSASMLCLSRLFLVDYDGWGSIMQPEIGKPYMSRQQRGH
jgi:hypothetical protein